ncbi:alcohol acetyltransferase [Brachybacterium tyrofermentans]|uniref:alcohol acetyltransferase n=1 Tax=Brachybacterium tyrofermentans TaxID=47848 RepID=UPI003FD446BD
MSRRRWVRLDNASNMFLAARSEVDPKVFRLGAEMDHEVDPQLLQEALEETYEKFPLYHAVLRRGVFWYYLQDSELRPTVTEEITAPCAPIYQADRRSLLFRVMHHRRRISLEVFHALSDGTGALWFLTDLVTAYTQLRFPPERADPPAADGAASDEQAASLIDPTLEVSPRDPVAMTGGEMPGGETASAKPGHDLTTDSFVHYFRRRRRRRADVWEARAAFSQEAEAEPTGVPDGVLSATDAPEHRAAPSSPARSVHRVRGTRTPDSRTRVVELTMPAKQVLDLARAERVALTMYLTAVFFESVRRSAGDLGRAPTLAASVPVNLRQFFPSTSARNFFATTRVEHTFGRGDDTLGAISRGLERAFRARATAEALEGKLRRFLRFERMPALRVMPRPLKDVILDQVNRASNRGLTLAVSNLGRVVLPEEVAVHVDRMIFQVSAVRPQFCAISHSGVLTVSFTSPFLETDHVREFARLLTASGVDVTVVAARVTEQELADAGEGTR